MNRRTTFRVLGTALLSLLPALLVAQEEKENQLSIDAQIMARGELRSGGLPDDDDDNPVGQAGFVLSRTRLTVDYQRPGLELKATAQHSGVWGQSGKGAFNLYEAWAKLTTRQGLFAKVGRQELSYDDQRIIGSNDWAVAAMSHDVLKLGYEGHGHRVHAILAYNQNAENTNGGSFYVNGAQAYKSMHNLWYHYDLPTIPLGASLLFMNIGMQGGETLGDDFTAYQQVLGGYVKFAPKHWTAEVSYYRQMGHNEYNQKIRAWMGSVKLQYDPTPTYGFVGGFDYLSGDKYFAVPKPGALGLTRHDVISGFNPVYGSHHQFYGAMDFFYVSTYVNGFSPGLQNAFIGGHYNPMKGLRLDVSYHYLATSTKLSEIDMTLGHEIELSASYQLMNDCKLSAGYSFMMGTKSMVRLKRAADDRYLRWAWLTLNISPRIFTTRW